MNQEPPITESEFRRLKLFQGVDFDLVRPVLRDCTVRRLAKNELLIRAGDSNQNLYLIVDGSVSVHLETPERGALVTLPAGDCIGELSLIDHQPISASVRGVSACRLLVMKEETLWRLVRVSHSVSCNLLFMLAERLREGNELIRRSREALNEFQVQVTLDGLTGLQNRLWLDSTLPRFVERAVHNDESLAVLMIDIDYFKQYNDEHGHLSGDAALHTLAKALRSNLRPGDMAARYGGDEFVVVLPNATLHDAQVIAERLRGRVRDLSKQLDTPAITISVGTAELQQGQDEDDLLRQADQALYRAKEAGRDRAAV